MDDVLARVPRLLGGERARVPAREARALGQAHVEDLGEQRVVRGLRAEPGEARRDLRVEHVAHLGGEAPAHERDVLAPGVDDHLDRGVGEDRRQRRAVEVLLERVDQLDPLGIGGIRVGDRQLDQAEQRAVAALAHELRVEREPPGGPGASRQRVQRAVRELAHGFAPGNRYRSL